MTTIATRQTHYVDQTLESLSRSDGCDVPVNLILGSADTSHVERYRGVVNIVPWDEEAQSRFREDRPRYNCSLNAVRALRCGASERCLCCEDDVRFEENWLSHLHLTIEQMPDPEYVLNLCLDGDPSPDKRYSADTRRYLVGAQALFYPTKALRSRVADFVEANMRRGMNDNLIGEYAKQHCALYRTNPKLAHHIGQVSSFHMPQPAAPTTG
jgi:hypothetical protein